MIRRLFAVSFVVLLAVSLGAAGAVAADQSSNITGLFLTTKYPGLTVRAGETTTVDLALRNFKLPPQSLTLSVPEAADGWKATILGGGQPITAVQVAPDSEERLQLRLEPPAGTGKGEYRFTVQAKSAQHDEKLPITLTIGEELPANRDDFVQVPRDRGE